MMRKWIKTLMVLSLLMNFALAKDNDLAWLDEYNVEWDSQSKNVSGSMPCGGGDRGMNVWVENDDILFYIDRSGNLNENDQLVKSGRVRLKISPNPFKMADVAFSQKLDLKSGAVYIEAKNAKTNQEYAKIKIWSQIDMPVIHIQVQTHSESKVEATFESWRNEKVVIPMSSNGSGGAKDFNRWACYGYVAYQGDVFSYPDKIDFLNNDKVLFYHQNGEDRIFDKEARMQGLSDYLDELNNPTKDRIFGGLMYGENMVSAGNTEGAYANTPFKGWSLKSVKDKKNHNIKIVFNTQKVKDLSAWKKTLAKNVLNSDAEKLEKSWHKNLAWWKNFWNRSYIIINSGADKSDIGWQVGRNYQLMRYMLACNFYGELPTHFNGGFFTYDHMYVDYRKDTDPSFYNADYRKWGAWTAMNQRLVHWAMLKSGDFDMMLPQFDFYNNNLKNAQLRNKVPFGIDGCSFAEQINTGGLPNGYHYGWTAPYGNRKEGVKLGMQSHHVHYFHTQLEFAYMMHLWHKFSGKDISKYIEFMKDSVVFHFKYHTMFQRKRTGKDWDENGKLVMRDMQSTETYKPGTNPQPELASLKQNLKLLISLPDNLVSPQEKEIFKDWLTRVPELNFRERNGFKTLSPLLEEAPSNRLCNRELAQLYPVFPYGMYSLGQDDLDVAINTWKYGLDKAGKTYLADLYGGEDVYPQKLAWWGWGQQAIMLARMGLAEEASYYISKKLADANGEPLTNEAYKARFPAFFGPGYGCMPSIEWGATGMIGLQEMLLQTIADDAKELRILPAWNKDWNVKFKLYAPSETTVECDYQNGKIKDLKVSKESRKQNLVLPN